MPLHADNLSDRELLIAAIQKIDQINTHLSQQNGRLAKLEGVQQTQAVQLAQAAGALGFGRWLLAAILAMMAAGSTLAGIVLAVVSQQ